MKKTCILTLIACTFALCACNNGQKAQQTAEAEKQEIGLPVIDFAKEYPVERIMLQDIADVEYIPLETNGNSLLTGVNDITMNEQAIVTCNWQTKSVLIFDRNGKHLKTFNRYGQSGEEYIDVIHPTADFERREVYVHDHRMGKSSQILVYSFEGKYLRSLSLPKDFEVQMYNYDKDHLFIEEWHNSDGVRKDEAPASLTPYYLLSKETGELKQVPIQLKERVRNMMKIQIKTPNNQIIDAPYITSLFRPVEKTGEQMIIADFALDTIYTYQKDQLTPVAVKANRISSQGNAYMTNPLFLTDRYLALRTQERGVKGTFDVSKGANKGIDFPDIHQYLIDRKTGEVKKVIWEDANGIKAKIDSKGEEEELMLNIHNFDLSGKWAMMDYAPDFLLEKHAKGELKGELAELAATLKEDDNPVLVLVKLKE